MEGFGPDLYRWERDYFRNHFVSDVCGIKLEPSFEKELETELSNLAKRLSGTMRSLIHRDLQSQNVMIRNGEPFSYSRMRFQSFKPWLPLFAILCCFRDNESKNLSFIMGWGHRS
jgi:hypothetical protein